MIRLSPNVRILKEIEERYIFCNRNIYMKKQHTENNLDKDFNQDLCNIRLSVLPNKFDEIFCIKKI